MGAERLGRAVKHARLRRRLTQAQLASRAGLGVATLQRLEGGDPGIALGSFLEVLLVLERDWAQDIVQLLEQDLPGRALELRRLPARVGKSDAF